MSSFKRAQRGPGTGSGSGSVPGSSVESVSSSSVNDDQPVSMTVSGTKPWVSSGLGIVSTGNKQLDELIGGGSALGTLTLIECDGFSNYGETLMVYNLVEALSHQHPVMLLAEDEVETSRIISTLPYNQTIGADSSIAAEDSAQDNSSTDKTNNLTIAWQYSKYMKTKNQAPSSSLSSRVSEEGRALPTYCCSYDLSRRIQDSLLSGCVIELCLADRAITDGGVDDCLNHMVEAVAAFLLTQKAQARRVSRVVISGLDQVFCCVTRKTGSVVSSRSAAKFILSLKHVVRTSRVHVLVTMNPTAVSRDTNLRIRQMADTLLSVESFAGRSHSVPYEFKDFQGFLVVHKIQNYGSMAPFRPPGTRFGLKRDRRKLHIEPLHLPPEESRTFSTTGGATTANAPTQSSSIGVAGAVPGVPIGIAVSSHTHDHEHKHSVDNNHIASTQSTVAVASTSMAATGTAPPTLTPLQASLAALKAARQQSAASSSAQSMGSNSTPGHMFSPVTIHRTPVSSLPSPPSGEVIGKTPPLQPGQACGSHVPGTGGTKISYDF